MIAQSGIQKMQGFAREFAEARPDRQRRQELMRDDSDRIRDTGFLLIGVPVDAGGIWENVERSTRPICEMVRALVHGDSSVALVSAMHPAVISFWLATPHASPEHQPAWQEQRKWIWEAAAEGASWGTITSEPGSGGDSSYM